MTSKQAEINRLEDDKYNAEHRAQEAADLMMWSLRRLKQNSPGRYAGLVSVMKTCEISDFDELVEEWIDERRRFHTADRELWELESPPA